MPAALLNYGKMPQVEAQKGKEPQMSAAVMPQYSGPEVSNEKKPINTGIVPPRADVMAPAVSIMNLKEKFQGNKKPEVRP